MFLFGKRRNNKFNAALNAVMAEITLEHLPDDARQQVEDVALELLQASGHREHSHLTFYSMPRALLLSLYCAAMIKLGIDPTIQEEHWRQLSPFGSNPFSNDEEFEEAEEMALEYLEKTYGLDL